MLSWGIIHGDATLDNVLLLDDGQLGVYDFDQSGPGWLAYELQGVFAWAWESQQPGFWSALLDGYRSVRPLSDADIAAMPCFPVLNKLWCLGLEAQYIARTHGTWLIHSALDERVAWLRRWAAAHPEIGGAA